MNKAYEKLIEKINSTVLTANINSKNVAIAFMDDAVQKGDSRYRATLIVRHQGKGAISIIQASYDRYDDATGELVGFSLDRYVEVVDSVFVNSGDLLGTTTVKP